MVVIYHITEVCDKNPSIINWTAFANLQRPKTTDYLWKENI
jgi:hypothetical protein